MATAEAGARARSGLQPDSLKLVSQLVILKHLHQVAARLERTHGDKSGGKTFFLRGIQGEVTRPVWNRDYFYLNGLVQQVRVYFEENCVQTVLNELFNLAVDIFSRYDNRRRMGVELLQLCMLSSTSQTSWEIPEKYQAHCFVIDMLVSCRHRFQKPNSAAFWSKQSESLLLSTLRQTTKLSRLVLSLCNDVILKAISVECRNLSELEVQLADDVTEEGLLAIAGRSAQQTDLGLQKQWDHALYLQKDFGASREWYIKDAMMFTPTCTAKRSLPPKQCDKLIKTYTTFFGCNKLRKFRLFGDLIFPPMAARAKFNKYVNGPQLETGFYAFLVHLRLLQQFNVGFAPLVVARLATLLPPEQLATTRLGLTELVLGWEEQLEIHELQAIAKLCPEVRELKGVSIGILNDKYRSDRFLVDETVCDFMKKFGKLRKLSGNIKLTCLNSFLAHAGQNLNYLNCSSLVLSTTDLLVLRRYCVNLEKLEGRFSLDNTVDRTANEYHTDHNNEFSGTLHTQVNIDSPWIQWKEEISRWPWRNLKHMDLNGRTNLRVIQILVARADKLETLSITNWPNEMVSGGMAFDDSWIPGLIEANPMYNIKEFTIRMESDHFVEEGFLTKTSLNHLLQHAVSNCPKLERIVGEWTKIPDRELAQCEYDAASKGLDVKIRNAEPYRDFQNLEDNDRFYGMNEGYWRHNGGVSPHQLQQQDGEGESTVEEVQFRYPREWGYVYRPLN